MAKYTVARTFLDIDGITRQPGWQVELPLWRALKLYRYGFIVEPVYLPVPPEPWQVIHGTARRVTSWDENIAGLASAIVLANDLRTQLNAHYADALAHGPAPAVPDAVNTILGPGAISLPSLLTLTAEMLTSYAAHHADALLLGPWIFHVITGADFSLLSAVAPVDLQECITRLNDLKDKYNDHDNDDVAHTAFGTHEVLSADAANGPTIRMPVRGVLTTDLVAWGILNPGTGVVVGVRATPSNGYVDFEFSVDPQNDCVISYLVSRKI